MSRDSLTGEARVSFKCSEELSQMIDAVARYERRPLSAVCRIALNDYFANQNYYEAATIQKLSSRQPIESKKVPGSE
jgi:predicted transcriptional regulator